MKTTGSVSRDALREEVERMMKADKDSASNRFKNVNVSIENKGTKIVLPSDPYEMKPREAIQALEMRIKEDETTVAVNEIVKAFPFDGAYAFMKAMAALFGWSTPVPTPGFFGDTPPNTLSLEIDYGVTTQIIWGDFAIPGIEGVLSSGVWRDDSGMLYFCIQGKVKKRFMPDVQRIADLTRQIVKDHSIYRGKAIRLEVGKDGNLDFNKQPKFLNLTGINPDELTYSDHVMSQIKTNLFTPIEHTEVCRANRIPLKRGVLLEGPYGTGKTLAAFITALKCVANGWTFILLPQVSGLHGALTFARLYGPSVVFAEDIDRAFEGDKRTVSIDDILNTIDGIESKNSEIITILTSNHVENINQAMLRPGRLDAVIKVSPPDAKAAEKLMRIYSRGTLAENEDLTEAGQALAGRIPAVIREVVERAKLYAIGNGSYNEKGEVSITGKALTEAAHGMNTHLELLAPKSKEPSNAEKFYSSFQEMMKENPMLQNIDTFVKEVNQREDMELSLH